MTVDGKPDDSVACRLKNRRGKHTKKSSHAGMLSTDVDDMQEKLGAASASTQPHTLLSFPECRGAERLSPSKGSTEPARVRNSVSWRRHCARPVLKSLKRANRAGLRREKKSGKYCWTRGPLGWRPSPRWRLCLLPAPSILPK